MDRISVSVFWPNLAKCVLDFGVGVFLIYVCVQELWQAQEIGEKKGNPPDLLWQRPTLLVPSGLAHAHCMWAMAPNRGHNSTRRTRESHLGVSRFLLQRAFVMFVRLQISQLGPVGKCVNTLCVPPFLLEGKGSGKGVSGECSRSLPDDVQSLATKPFVNSADHSGVSRNRLPDAVCRTRSPKLLLVAAAPSADTEMTSRWLIILTIRPLIKGRRSLLAFVSFAFACGFRIGYSRRLGYSRLPSSLLPTVLHHTAIRTTPEAVAIKLLWLATFVFSIAAFSCLRWSWQGHQHPPMLQAHARLLARTSRSSVSASQRNLWRKLAQQGDL